MTSSNDSVRNPQGLFGSMVRDHRRRQKISLTELAREIDMDAGLLSKIERGLRPPPEVVPYVQRITQVLGLQPSSEAYRDLFQAASQERLEKSRKRRSKLISLGLPETPVHLPTSGGLGGLPPELIHPDSPAGRHYRSRGIEVGHSLVGLPAGQPQASDQGSAPAPPVSRELAFQTFALELLSSLGLVVTRLVQVGARWELDFRTLDGEQFEVVCSPKKSPSKNAEKGRRSTKRR